MYTVKVTIQDKNYNVLQRASALVRADNHIALLDKVRDWARARPHLIVTTRSDSANPVKPIGIFHTSRDPLWR